MSLLKGRQEQGGDMEVVVSGGSGIVVTAGREEGGAA